MLIHNYSVEIFLKITKTISAVGLLNIQYVRPLIYADFLDERNPRK